jgi:hypothetical protein
MAVRELPPLRPLPEDTCDICGAREEDEDFLPLDEVVAGGLIVPACWRCWQRWPLGHKYRSYRSAAAWERADLESEVWSA